MMPGIFLFFVVMDWMFVFSENSYVKILISNVMVFRRWDPWNVIGS
jgi:hypothetical protein